MSDGTFNTPNTNTSTWVSNGSENNTRVADTYTHKISWEVNIETDSTLTPGILAETSHGNTDSEATDNMAIDTLIRGVPQSCGNTISGNEVTGRNMQNEHNAFVHPIYAVDTTCPVWEDNKYVYCVLNSPPAKDYWKELDNSDAKMN